MKTPVAEVVQELGEPGRAADLKELKQLALTKKVFKPVYYADVPKKFNGKPNCISARTTLKVKSDGTVNARNVGGGHLQDRTVYDIIDELSLPTVMNESINLCMKVAVSLDMLIVTIDIVGAYLNARMTHDVYMRFSPCETKILCER